MPRLIMISLTAAIASGAMLVSAYAADRFISDGARGSNTYQTYHSGSPGCVEDLGYGRVRDGCGGE